MSCRIFTFPSFDRELKHLAKRYKSINEDLRSLANELKENPRMGSDLGNGLRKVRLSIKSKGTGKRGGARVITVVVSDLDDNLGLLYIYDKSDRETIKGKELEELLKKNRLI